MKKKNSIIQKAREMKKNSKIIQKAREILGIILGSVVIASFILIICLLVDNKVIDCLENSCGLDNIRLELITNLLEGIVAAAAAGLIVFELDLSQQKERRENELQEASFIFQYNQSFIEDKNMRKVETLLEDKMMFLKEGDIITDSNRQDFINYLVYLEGLAPPILNGIMKLEHIDDLMAYRFFLALCCIEVQEKQMKEYPQYYRGCFKLYKKWKDYYDELKAENKDRSNVLGGILYKDKEQTIMKPCARELTELKEIYNKYSNPKD